MKKQTSRQSGFSLIEVVVALGLAVVMIFFVADLITTSLREGVDSEEAGANLADVSLGLGSIASDMRRAGVSLNTLNIPDDVTKRNFFDYYADVPIVKIPQSLRQRSLTISLKPGSRKEMIFLLDSRANSKTLVYDPVLAYDIEEPPQDWALPGAVTYRGVNRGNAMIRLFGDSWKQDQLFKFYVPAPLRPPGSAIDFTEPARNLFFIGSARELDVAPHGLEEKIIHSTHPMDSRVTINSMDTFFRTVPPIGGSAPVVFAQPVFAVRFSIGELNETKGKPSQALFQETLIQGKWSKQRVLIRDVESVTFNRPRVTLPEIEVKVDLKGKNAETQEGD